MGVLRVRWVPPLVPGRSMHLNAAYGNVHDAQHLQCRGLCVTCTVGDARDLKRCTTAAVQYTDKGRAVALAGIVALNLFMGKLHNRCVLLPGDPDAANATSPSPSSAFASADPSAFAVLPPPPPFTPGAWGNDSSGGGDDGGGEGDGTWSGWDLLPGYEDRPCGRGRAGLFHCPAGA